MARHNSDDMDWEPTDYAASDQDYDPADSSDCESEDPFWESDEQYAKEKLKETLGEDVDVDIDNFLDPLPHTTTQDSPKRKHKKPCTTPQKSPKPKRQKPNTRSPRRPKPKDKKADFTPQPKLVLKLQKTQPYDPEGMVKELLDATKCWAPVGSQYYKFDDGQAKWDLAEAFLLGLQGTDQWRRWRKEVARRLDRMMFKGMEIETYDDSKQFIILSISPPSTRMKYARDNTAPAPQLSPERKRFVKISTGGSDLTTLPENIKYEAEFTAAFLRHHGYNIEEVHAFFLHVASCPVASRFVKLWANGDEILNWSVVKESDGFREGKLTYIFNFLYDTRFLPREKDAIKQMMTSWTANGWDTYNTWKETLPNEKKTPNGVTHGAHRLSKGDHKGLTPVVFRVDYKSEKDVFRSTSTLEPSFPSNDKKHRFWILSLRRPDDRHDTETCYVAFAKSPTNAYIEKMKHALAAALPWPVTSVSAKQGEVLQADAFDRFGRIHPRVQPILVKLFNSMSGPQSPPEKIRLHRLFKGTETKDAGSLLVILLRVSMANNRYSSPSQQLRQILSKLPEHPDVRKGKVSSVFLVYERESSFMKTWDERKVRGKIEARAAGRPVHLCTARPTRGTRQVGDLDRIQESVTTWRTLGVADSQWVECFDPKRQDEVKACISKESGHLDHTLHVASRDRAMKRFVALQACKPDSEDIEMLEKFALAQLPKDQPVQTVTRSSPFKSSGNAGRAKETLATQKRHELHQQFLRTFAPEAGEICLMNTTAYTNSKENEISKVLEEVKDPTIFLFTAVDRIAHTHARWQEVKEVAEKKGHTVMVLFLYGAEPLAGSSVFRDLQDCITQAAKWDEFMKERTNSDNISGLIQPTVVIAPGRKIHKDVEGRIQRSFKVSEAFVQAKDHARGATKAAFPGMTASLADRNTRWDAVLPVLKQAVEQLTDLPGGLVEADEVTPDCTEKECKCGPKCFDTCSCLRYGCHPLPSLCGHRDEHGQLRPRVSLAAPNCIKCTQEQSPCQRGCRDSDNHAIPSLAKGLCKKCLEELPCINGADCEGVQKNGEIGSRWRADYAECDNCLLQKPCTTCKKNTRTRPNFAKCDNCLLEKPCTTCKKNTRTRPNFAECDNCLLEKPCTNCKKNTRWRADYAECERCLLEKPCTKCKENTRWRAGSPECERCLLEKPCTKCKKNTRWRAALPECKDCHKEGPCGKGQECVGFKENGKPNQRGDPDAKFCRGCRAKSQRDCPFQPLGCSNTSGMASGRRLPSCVECGAERRFCSREGCTRNATVRKSDCATCDHKPAKAKPGYITCKGDGCKKTAWLWKGPKEAEWLRKDQLLPERQFCIDHLVEHLLKGEHAAETQGSTSGVGNDDDTPNANNNTEAARAAQADTWLRDSCWNEVVRTSINNKVAENGVDMVLAIALSTIQGMWGEQKPPEDDEEYAEIVTHFVTLLALGEDHSFTEDFQETIRGSAKWLQKIYAEVLAENKKLTRIIAMCKTG